MAKLVPNPAQRRFEIEIHSGVSATEMQVAERGTVQDGHLVYALEGKTYRTSIKTLRGDYRDAEGNTANRLRRWEKQDFKPRPEDVFQERLYCIQWMRHDTLDSHRPETFFAAVTEEDLGRERRVEAMVAEHLAEWQEQGLVPDMAIEPGDKTDEPIRTRGWMYWHQLFSARDILGLHLFSASARWKVGKRSDAAFVAIPMMADNVSKICGWNSGHPGSGEFTINVFNNQALNTQFSYSCRSTAHAAESLLGRAATRSSPISTANFVQTFDAVQISFQADLFVTDPPYADAVHYHEITEFFIAWLRKNPPPPFDQWTWDSRRELAIKGSGDDFRRGMVDAYQAMTNHMPDNGM